MGLLQVATVLRKFCEQSGRIQSQTESITCCMQMIHQSFSRGTKKSPWTKLKLREMYLVCKLYTAPSPSCRKLRGQERVRIAPVHESTAETHKDAHATVPKSNCSANRRNLKSTGTLHPTPIPVGLGLLPTNPTDLSY